MFISQFLCEACIIPDLTAETKKEALKSLSVRAAELLPHTPMEEIFQTIWDREQLGSTGIGAGVAIPHGKIKGIEQLMVIFARSKTGVPFDALDSKNVHAIFLLLAPETASTVYLKILARISRLLKTPNAYEKLMAAQDAKNIRRVIEKIDSTLPLSI